MVVLCATSTLSQGTPAWQDDVRASISRHDLQAALQLTEIRLRSAPDDFEAHGWRGHLLAWQGRWSEAEAEYRLVLQHHPADADVLIALADVLVWQAKLEEALAVLDRVRELAPAEPEALLRRARVMEALQRDAPARAQYREILALDPANPEARKAPSAVPEQLRHELRAGIDIDTFNYTDSAQAQTFALASRWNRRWSTLLGTSLYQRFGQEAGKFSAGVNFRFRRRDWLGVEGAVAHDNSVIPQHEAGFEYGHALQLHRKAIRGIEVSYRQHWLWYRGAHVLTIAFNQLYYLPKDWFWGLSITGARSGFAGTGVDWAPSGSTRLGFPLYRRLSGNVAFAVGSENFAQVDQIGRFAARTFSGGIRYRLSSRHDVTGYVASQDRSQHRSQNSFGLSYGFHF